MCIDVNVPRKTIVFLSGRHSPPTCLKIAWNRDKFFVNIEDIRPLVATAAKRHNVPLLVCAICLLHMSSNQISPMVTICCTAPISRMACMMVPIVEPGVVSCRCCITTRTVYIFYFHFINTTLICGSNHIPKP